MALGGLVDVEFLTHFIQLRDAPTLSPEALSPHLDTAIAALVVAGLLEPEVAPAHRLMADALVAGRLLAPDGNPPPPAAAKALARACQCDSYAQLTGRLDAAQQCIARSWTRIFGHNRSNAT